MGAMRSCRSSSVREMKTFDIYREIFGEQRRARTTSVGVSRELMMSGLWRIVWSDPLQGNQHHRETRQDFVRVWLLIQKGSPPPNNGITL